MTDATTGPSWQQAIDALEAMSPEQLAAAIGGSLTPAQIAEDFPELSDVAVRTFAIDGPHGEVPARLFQTPSTEVGPALVWVHGGGFVGGDLDMPAAHWVGLALAARGIPVLSIDYRKCLHGIAFPVPSDDVLAGWLWAAEHAADLGTTIDRLHLGGGSAGGNLVAGVGKRLRDGAGPLPATLVLSPRRHRLPGHRERQPRPAQPPGRPHRTHVLTPTCRDAQRSPHRTPDHDAGIAVAADPGRTGVGIAICAAYSEVSYKRRRSLYFPDPTGARGAANVRQGARPCRRRIGDDDRPRTNPRSRRLG